MSGDDTQRLFLIPPYRVHPEHLAVPWLDVSHSACHGIEVERLYVRDWLLLWGHPYEGLRLFRNKSSMRCLGT